MASTKKKQESKDRGLVDIVFSWSIADVVNRNLYSNKVKQIPERFSSTNHYLESFIYPLIEETHADLFSSMTTIYCAPVCEVFDIKVSKGHKPPKNLYYSISLKQLRENEKRERMYEPESGDLIALTDVRPKCIDDLNRPKRPYLLALIQGSNEFGLRILSSKPIDFEKQGNEKGEKGDKLFAVYLTNLTTNTRIWKALNPDPEGANMSIIRGVLQAEPSVGGNCTVCSSEKSKGDNESQSHAAICHFELDKSQKTAVLNCIAMRDCNHQNTVNLIWGPPGTGKTKTVASLLFALLKMKCRTLTCAPTNIAVLGVTNRLMSLVRPTLKYDTYGLGDIVLFGNGERMKIDDHEDLLDVFLAYRVDALSNCLAPLSGWKGSSDSMIRLLKHPMKQYKDKNRKNRKQWNRRETPLTFDEFFMKELNSVGKRLIFCITSLYTHMPTSFIQMKLAKDMIRVVDMLHALGTLFHQVAVANKGLRKFFDGIETAGGKKRHFNELTLTRMECLVKLKLLQKKISLPDLTEDYEIRSFCLRSACLIFCTASSSTKLHTEGMTASSSTKLHTEGMTASSSTKLHTEEMAPLELLIIDEAAQLKECESTIPLQLPGLRHAVLIGDEKQLPAMVQSKICEKADFGRSLFERLVMLGHHRHLLNIQYRMHPSISLFPNREFYGNRIMNGSNVKNVTYNKSFLGGRIFGTYSFIDINHGKEQLDDRHSTKNNVEVYVIAEIVANLHKKHLVSKQKVRIGCISPYKAQVSAIQEKLGKTYSADVCSDFSVNVRSVDGFQGGEEDIIIISTVRCNGYGSIGFLCNHQRTNVALTRARHCLWILGNSATLINSRSVWKKLVLDAKSRGCFHNATDDKNLVQAMSSALIELHQYDKILNSDSMLFNTARWKVCFRDEFSKSLTRIQDSEVRNEVLSLLVKLSSGWRQPQNDKMINENCGASSKLLELYDVKGLLKLVWTKDIQRDNLNDIQVIKVLDILSESEIPKLAEHLDKLFENYTVKTMDRCKCKRMEGNLEVPVTWPLESGSVLRTDPAGDEPSERLINELAAINLNDEPRPSTSSYRNYDKYHKDLKKEPFE